ncbi:uncharacterized protein LOC119607389 [Lucilia sericata]|uniref:uncharacterized protein LOC119607389 n=1 Tax=Lucilia sericata TaxID=13632 RepID=UPI0018A7FDBD|nr:uncharacterized protein LOC119607389 [Lucilia sericata]
MCHFKCSGLSGLVAEAVCKTKGLHWCCNACQKIGVEYYRFFQGTKNTFLNIQNKLSALSNEVSAYGNLFEEFKQLNCLNSPPQSSPKRRKSSRNKNKFSQSPGPTSNVDDSDSITPITSITFSNNCATAPKPISDSVNQSQTPIKVKDGIVSDTAPTVSQISNVGLKIIPPNKSIFISRFASDTTVEQINSYIKSKLNSEVDFTTHKFSYSQPRRITSFKINVPCDEQIVNPEFWPENTLVREYEFKEYPRKQHVAILPSGHQLNNNLNSNNTSKN